MKNQLRQKLSILACAFAVSLVPTAAKADFLFHVDLNLSSLSGSDSAPFALDFQLNQGNGSQTNSVSLTNFSFAGTGAGPSGSATGYELATGDLGSSVTLNESSANPNAELYQALASGTTDVQFDVQVTQNSPGSIPDGFNLSILDNTLNNIATTDSTSSTMLDLAISTNNSVSDVATFTSTSPAGATVTVTSVPEPSSFAALLGGVATLVGFRRRRA